MKLVSALRAFLDDGGATATTALPTLTHSIVIANMQVILATGWAYSDAEAVYLSVELSCGRLEVGGVYAERLFALRVQTMFRWDRSDGPLV